MLEQLVVDTIHISGLFPNPSVLYSLQSMPAYRDMTRLLKTFMECSRRFHNGAAQGVERGETVWEAERTGST